MLNTPLWLCLQLTSGREHRGHHMFLAEGISSLPPLTHEVRVNRHHRTAAQRTVQRCMLPGYAFVARDTSEPTWFEGRLLRLRWLDTDTPVVHRIVGWVHHRSIMDLIATCEARVEIAPPTLKPGDKARIILAGDMREVQVSIIKGKQVRVLLDGREIRTTVDKLEAAA